MAYKEFKFHYCFAEMTDLTKNFPMIYSLHDFMEKLSALSPSQTIIDMGNFKAKTERIDIYEDRYIHLSLMKMTEFAMPFKVYDYDKKAEPIELDDDEYLGKDTHILYDMHNNVLMLQVTREALSDTCVQIYFNTLAHDFNLLNKQQVLEITRINDETSLNNKQKNKKIEIRFGNLENTTYYSGTFLGGIIDSFNKIGGIAGNITISTGRRSIKNFELEHDNVMQLTKELQDLRDKKVEAVSSAKITYMEEGKSFIYDLFDNVMNDIGRISVLPKTSIPFDDIGKMMLELYKNKLPKINSIIKYN